MVRILHCTQAVIGEGNQMDTHTHSNIVSASGEEEEKRISNQSNSMRTIKHFILKIDCLKYTQYINSH